MQKKCDKCEPVIVLVQYETIIRNSTDTIITIPMIKCSLCDCELDHEQNNRVFYAIVNLLKQYIRKFYEY